MPLSISSHDLTYADFDGILPISVESHSNDICTATLAELPMNTEYGLVHSMGYSSDFQLADVCLTTAGQTGTLEGTIVCSQDLNGKETVLIAAFYDEHGKMLNTWMETISSDNGSTFAMDGSLSSYAEVKLFVINEGLWIPLCPVITEVD